MKRNKMIKEYLGISAVYHISTSLNEQGNHAESFIKLTFYQGYHKTQLNLCKMATTIPMGTSLCLFSIDVFPIGFYLSSNGIC